jgi:hypothetical protein
LNLEDIVFPYVPYVYSHLFPPVSVHDLLALLSLPPPRRKGRANIALVVL